MDAAVNRQPTKDDVSTWLAEHGDALFRYALKRVGDRDLAEDLVQDTFVAALRAAGDFQGRSQVSTWLIGILRHKIADHMRKLTRQRERDAKHREETTQVDTFHNGHWRVGLKPWPSKAIASDPSKSVEMQEFWRVLDSCRDKLPTKLAIAFRMRDLEELPMTDICETLEITATNLSVRLHRARVLLRDCLDQNWFSAGEAT